MPLEDFWTRGHLRRGELNLDLKEKEKKNFRGGGAPPHFLILIKEKIF